MQELQANIKNVDVDPHLRRRPLRAPEGQEAPDEVHPGRRGALPGRLQGQGRLPLRPARHRQRHRLQHARSSPPPRRRGPGRTCSIRSGRASSSRRIPATAASSPPTCWPSCTSTAGTTSSSSPRTSPCSSSRPSIPRGVVASGERPVAVNGGDYTSTRSRRRATRSRSSSRRRACRSSSRRAPSPASRRIPNAARLFTDFIFSREIQQVLADSEGLYTGHPDVKYPADKPKLCDSSSSRWIRRSWRSATRRSRRASWSSSERRACRQPAGDAGRRVWHRAPWRAFGAGLDRARGSTARCRCWSAAALVLLILAAAGLARLHERERRAAASPSPTTRACSATRRCRRRSGTRVVLAFWSGLVVARHRRADGLAHRPHRPARASAVIRSLVHGVVRDAALPRRLRVGDARRPQRRATSTSSTGASPAPTDPLVNIFTMPGLIFVVAHLHLPLRLHHDRQHARR